FRFLYVFCFFFFFSSRRRHTRFSRDWSSDVCSSDLEADGALWMRTTDFGDDKDRVLDKSDGEHSYFASDTAYYVDKRERGFDLRSEERRVGKECSILWSLEP